MPAREATKSPVYNNDGSIDRTFNVWDVLDGEQAIGLAAAAAGTPYLGLDRADEPDCRPFGHSLWEVVYHYEAPVGPEGEGTEDPDPPSGNADDLAAVLEFDTTGGTQHITQCLSQTDSGAESGLQVKDALVIGASGDSLEGTDVVVPALSFTLSRRPPFVNGNYIKNLARTTGKTNTGPYTIRGKVLGIYVEIPFEDGELKFLGASPTGDSLIASGGQGRNGKFEASENQVNINMGNGLDGPINVPSKKGFEHLWTMFQKKELTTPKVAIPVPHIAFVAKLPPGETAFAAVLGF